MSANSYLNKIINYLALINSIHIVWHKHTINKLKCYNTLRS